MVAGEPAGAFLASACAVDVVKVTLCDLPDSSLYLQETYSMN